MKVLVFCCCVEQVENIANSLKTRGVLVLADTISVVKKFYNMYLNEKIGHSFILSYMNHGREGYFYLVYDTNVFSYTEVQNLIQRAKFDKSPCCHCSVK